MNKRNSNDNKHRITIDDDYIEILGSTDEDDEFEDVFSDSSRDVYSSSSRGVYISKAKSSDEDAVFVNKRLRRSYQELDFDEADDREPTQEVKLSGKESLKRRYQVLEDEEEDDEFSDYEEKRVRKGGKRKSPFLTIVALFLVGVIIFCVACMSFSGGIVGNFAEGVEIEHIADESSLASEGHVKNVLLIGSDKASGGSSRSDSIMMCSINSKTGKVTLVSILRDTHVEVPGHRESKINAAHSWGGPNLLIQTIEQNFGIKIDDYATVNFDMFEALVEGIGGIYIDVSEAEAQHMNSYFKLGDGGKADSVQAGENVYLNGYQTLCYARIRKLDSDFYRTERQRKIIAAIVENVKGSLNPAGVADIMATAKNVAPYIETTLDEGSLFSLLMSLGTCVVKSGGDTSGLMVSAQLPFEGTWWYSDEWDGSSISIDLEENRQMLYNLLYEDAPSVEEVTEE